MAEEDHARIVIIETHYIHITRQLEEIKTLITLQNGRVTKNEQWRIRATAVWAAAWTGFIIFFKNRLFGE